nr:hypothetical protein [Paracoccaceae bacterium]
DVADGVIWCSHATQAWRQSEAAVWEGVDPALFPRSMLLLTRIDKIASLHDRARVMARVRRETDGMFRAVYPISLTEALAAGDDPEVWAASGAEAFADALLETVQAMGREIAAGRAPADRRVPRAARASRSGDDAPAPTPDPAPVNPFDRLRARAAAGDDGPGTTGVLPRRVAAEGRTPRPQRA